MEGTKPFHRRLGYTPAIDGGGHDSQFVVMDIEFFRRGIVSNVRLQQDVAAQSFRNRIGSLG